jgi:hypothetical protein
METEKYGKDNNLHIFFYFGQARKGRERTNLAEKFFNRIHMYIAVKRRS